uniref:Uncharacterized protein n=1 Tax=Picea glauca TaxID=3330 RepID=A0A101LZD3_PICGL|nr:hypothetical protein ABT39_MTgene5008 [Picea glauca]QHR86564.1 hypothetical protein Q903MT_gene567 [Picea sitchensis]
MFEKAKRHNFSHFYPLRSPVLALTLFFCPCRFGARLRFPPTFPRIPEAAYRTHPLRYPLPSRTLPT